MVAEPYVMQGQLNCEIEEAVTAGFSESGLVRKISDTGGEPLIQGVNYCGFRSTLNPQRF